MLARRIGSDYHDVLSQCVGDPISLRARAHPTIISVPNVRSVGDAAWIESQRYQQLRGLDHWRGLKMLNSQRMHLLWQFRRSAKKITGVGVLSAAV